MPTGYTFFDLAEPIEERPTVFAHRNGRIDFLCDLSFWLYRSPESYPNFDKLH